MMRFSVSPLVALIVLPIAVLAQVPAPNGRILALGSDTLVVYSIQGSDTTETGLIIDNLSVRSEGERSLLWRIYRTSDAILGNRVDTLVDALHDLTPVRHRSRSAATLERLRFERGRVSGIVYLPNGDSIRVDAPLAENVINSSSFDLVLRASPLATGWSAEIPAFIPTLRAILYLRARVDGSESIDGADCWRVEAEFGGTPVTFWIDKDSRKLRQQLMTLRPDFSILFAQPRASRQLRHAT